MSILLSVILHYLLWFQGAVVFLIVWLFDLQLPLQSVTITTEVGFWIPLRQGVLDTTLCDQICQWLATGWWFSLGTTFSSTNKTEHLDITEILLKVAEGYGWDPSYWFSPATFMSLFQARTWIPITNASLLLWRFKKVRADKNMLNYQNLTSQDKHSHLWKTQYEVQEGVFLCLRWWVNTSELNGFSECLWM